MSGISAGHKEIFHYTIFPKHHYLSHKFVQLLLKCEVPIPSLEHAEFHLQMRVLHQSTHNRATRKVIYPFWFFTAQVLLQNISLRSSLIVLLRKYKLRQSNLSEFWPHRYLATASEPNIRASDRRPTKWRGPDLRNLRSMELLQRNKQNSIPLVEKNRLNNLLSFSQPSENDNRTTNCILELQL